jgi:hypothetical protein
MENLTKLKSNAMNTTKSSMYTARSMNVPVVEFVWWRLIKTVQMSLFLKDGELDMLLISCNILYVLKCKLTLSNGHQSF